MRMFSPLTLRVLIILSPPFIIFSLTRKKQYITASALCQGANFPLQNAQDVRDFVKWALLSMYPGRAGAVQYLIIQRKEEKLWI